MNEEITSKNHRCEAISEIISSVAAEQKGLASILNIESEKIKYMMSISKEPQDLLDVNRSVEKMISTITKLEVILASKLELFDDCLCVKCDEEKSSGYSILSMTVETENGGRIEREDDMKTFKYYPGTTATTIKFITEPEAVINYVEGMPTGLKFDTNKLYIPEGFSWPQTYRMIFTVGEGENLYEITLFNVV